MLLVGAGKDASEGALVLLVGSGEGALVTG